MICRICRKGMTIVFALLLNVLFCQTVAGKVIYTSINTRGIAECVPVYSITQDATGMIWLGTRDGVMSYDGYELRNYGLPGLGRILRLEACGDTISANCQRGDILFNTSKGLFDKSKRQAERNDEVWMTRHFGRYVTARLDINDHASYIGTGDSLMLVERKTGRILRGWQMPVVKTLLRSDTLLYIGTDDGLFLLQPDGSLEHRNHDALFPKTSLAGDVVWCLFEDRDGNIWIGTDNGVSIIERNPYIRWLSIPELTGGKRGNNIDNVMKDSKGRIWLGGTNGLICVERLWQKGQQYRWYRMGDKQYSIPHNRIHKVFEDSNHRIWVCSDGGLLQYDERSEQVVNRHIANRQYPWTYQIREVNGGRLEVVMADTTYIFDAETLKVVEKRKTTERSEQSCTPTEPQTHNPTPDFFYATDRVGFFNREAFAASRHSGRPITITSVCASGRYIGNDTVRAGYVEVPFHENNITVSFSDFNYSAEHLVHYFYRIDDGQWQLIDQGCGKITLASLPVGKHNLYIDTLATQTAVPTSTPFLIHILPPWYLSWPMKTLYTLVFIAFVIAVIFYFVQRKTLRMEREQRDVMFQLAREKEELLQRELVATVQNETEQPITPSIDDAFLLCITQHIEGNLDNPKLSAAMLSDLCGVSQKQLYRKIRKLTAMTTVEYIRHIRMQHAARLLAVGNFTVSEVMYRVGFTNASYFSRAFAAAHDQTPSEYKLRCAR